jgi:hypothetical protein
MEKKKKKKRKEKKKVPLHWPTLLMTLNLALL